MRRRSEAQSGRYGGYDYRWVSDWQSVQSGLITCWNIWIDKREDCELIVLQCYAGTRSLYIQEGRQDKRTEDCPPRAGARGLSHVRTPPHLRTPPYSDKYALQGRKHIATLRGARPDIIEIRWCPAYKRIARNEKADEWAKIVAEKRDTHGVEWPNYSDRAEVRAMPLQRSLDIIKWEISEKMSAEARQWAGCRTSKTKYRMPNSQRPDEAAAGSTKRLASRYYQLKTGHARIGQYLH